MSYNENREYCRQIAETIEKIASGCYFMGNDGELYPIFEHDAEFWESNEDCYYNKEEEYYMIDNDIIDAADVEPYSLYNYFYDEVLDFEIIIDRFYNYSHAKLYITLGGPTVWVNTFDNEICLSWGTDTASYPVDYNAVAELDSIIEEDYRNHREYY